MTKHATCNKRLEKHTFAKAGRNQGKIAAELSWNQQSVSYLINRNVTPGKRKGCPLFDQAKQQRLVDFVTKSLENGPSEYVLFSF
jgi:hypothetical protein